MDSTNLVRVKLWSDRKHYQVIEVREDEVEKVREANRMTWKADKAEERRRIRMEQNGISVCSYESLDEDGSWLADSEQICPEDKLIRDEERTKQMLILKQALSSLTDKQKAVVFKYFVEKKSIAEIALIMGVHFMSVKDCFDCAIKKMRKFFQ